MQQWCEQNEGLHEERPIPSHSWKDRELIGASAINAAARQPGAEPNSARCARALLRAAAIAAAAYLLSACAEQDFFDRWPIIIRVDYDPVVESAAETPPPAEEAQPQAKSSREIVLAAQRMLVDLGHKPGPLDGIEGPKTRRAVRRFQDDAGLAVDGKVSNTLLAKLAVSDGPLPVPKPRHGLDGKVKPAYEPGDIFVYSDGRVETVAGVEGDQIVWKNNRGVHFTTHRNFILPPDFGIAVPQDEAKAADALWPLEIGKEIQFAVTSEVGHLPPPGANGGSAQSRRCRVDGVDKITVAAGTFDTFRIVCQGVAAPPLTRVWYYAPRIGYYVRRDDTDDAKELTRRVELVAMRLEGRGWPPAARAGLSWAFQHALETQSSGETVEWQSTGVDTQVTIRPTAAHISGQSSYCRTFEQTIVRQDSRRIFPGVACREPSGQWSIPGFDEKDGSTKSRS